MRKGTKIFIFSLILEIVLLLIGILFRKGTCTYSTPCSVPSFFNPLGIQLGGCVQIIVQAPCNLGLIYQVIWLIIFTAIAYIIYLIKNKRKNPTN